MNLFLQRMTPTLCFASLTGSKSSRLPASPPSAFGRRIRRPSHTKRAEKGKRKERGKKYKSSPPSPPDSVPGEVGGYGPAPVGRGQLLRLGGGG